MSRIVWLLVFVLAAILLVPSLRERARPQIEFALNPIYTWEARNRANEIVRTLESERSLGSPIPRPRELEKLLVRRDGEGAAQDPWGSTYYMERSRHDFRIVSPGPDRAAGTADDVSSQTRPLDATR